MNFLIYLCVVIPLGLFAAYHLGKVSDYTREQIGSLIVIMVLFWPIVILFAFIIGPFYGMFRLGETIKHKNIEKK